MQNPRERTKLPRPTASALLLAAALVCLARPLAWAGADDPAPLDAAGFRDGASHWRRLRSDERVIQPTADQPAYRPEQFEEIVANILLFQRETGGWPKDYDMLAILTPEQRRAVEATRNREDSSFDNHNTHTQVDYLARALLRRDEPTWRVACLRGFDFMLAAQLPCGGFPQKFPGPTGYQRTITLNDGVMMGVLGVLDDAARGAPQWSWLDEERRQRARQAVARGVACLLKCQIRSQGKLTGWCQQHDPETFEPTSARTFELASICPQETTEVVRFLMNRPAEETRPAEDIAAAIEAAVAWLGQAELTGVRVERVPLEPVEFAHRAVDFDAVVVADPLAPPLWARHYEIGSDRPIFAGRDAVRRYALAEIELERRTGTVWYGVWPERLIRREYPQWRAGREGK